MTRRSPDDAFLEVVAHELRTPVTTIYAAAYVLARDRLGDDDRTMIAGDLVHEVERLYRLVEDLLVYGRASSPEGVEHEPVLVSRVVLEVIEQERTLVSDHRIAFSGPRDAVAEGADPTMVRHIVRNLLDNAIRYAPLGGTVEVVVHVTVDEVVVRVLDGSRHEGSVNDDSALAIHPRDRPRTAAQRAGAGLRLHVASRLATAMGGRTWAGPRDGAGAEFGFALPRSA
jgi:two-component system sensor histidine kinase KdpD